MSRIEISIEDSLLDESVYYSTGGGFIVKEGELTGQSDAVKLPAFRYSSSKELSEICLTYGL